MGGRDHSCEVCGRGGFNDPDGECTCAERSLPPPELPDHAPFIEQAQNFKIQLEEAGFNAEEVAAMLGSFFLANYQQQFVTQYPPEMMEMLTKTNLINEEVLARRDDDDV